MLTADEAEQLRSLLVRYCREELDQFDTWRISSEYGTIFVTISNKELIGGSESSYSDISLPRGQRQPAHRDPTP